MDFKCEIIWTEKAIRDLDEIVKYLQFKWSDKVANNFIKRLSKLLMTISKNPFLFSSSQIQPRLRRAILRKQTVLFYEFKDNTVYIVSMYSTYQNITKLL